MDTVKSNASATSGAPLHPFEGARLASVREFEPLVRDDDAAMVAIAREAMELCAATLGIVSLMEATEERILAMVGSPRRTIPRRESLCSHSILDPYVTVVEDLSKDPRFERLPYVAGDPFLRFYAGAPILDATGLPLGTVCVLSPKPQAISAKCQLALAGLAEVASAVLETRLLLSDAAAAVRPPRTSQPLQARLDALLVTLIEPRPSCS